MFLFSLSCTFSYLQVFPISAFVQNKYTLTLKYNNHVNCLFIYFSSFVLFYPQNERHEQQRQALEAKVKALENELERARNRLKSLREQADDRVGVYISLGRFLIELVSK